MKFFRCLYWWPTSLAGLMMLCVGCCGPWARGKQQAALPPPMLGYQVDDIFRMQEQNAEASKFVVYQHEFELNQNKAGHSFGGWRLNEDGEDHVKKIAEQMRCGVHWPVVVERSRTSALPRTVHKFPVHFNPDLDLKRREVVVRALVAFGVHNADERVIVAPAFAEGIEQPEAERAYLRGIQGAGGRGLGGGGGFGGTGFF